MVVPIGGGTISWIKLHKGKLKNKGVQKAQGLNKEHAGTNINLQID